MSLSDVIQALEKAGSEQTRKTYARHGARGPMFGVSFGTLSALQKRIRVDHELALKLWDTVNVDARNLAMKIAEPAVIKPSDLDRWARENGMGMCNLYIGSLASESPHGTAKAREWLASTDVKLRTAGWTLVGILANRDEATPDAAFAKRLEKIEKSIHSAPNEEKAAMNGALIAIGGRGAALRKAACAAAKRIGKVEVDHGDTACETPDAISYIEKMWARSQGKFPVTVTASTPSGATAQASLDGIRTKTVQARWGIRNATGTLVFGSTFLAQNDANLHGDETWLNCRFDVSGSVVAPRSISLTYTRPPGDCQAFNVPVSLTFTGVADDGINSFPGTLTPGGPATLVKCPEPFRCQ